MERMARAKLNNTNFPLYVHAHLSRFGEDVEQKVGGLPNVSASSDLLAVAAGLGRAIG